MKRLALLLPVALVLAGCGGSQPEPVTGASRSAAPSPPPEQAAMVADTVQGWTDASGRPFEVTRRLPGDPTHLYRIIGTKTYPLSLRTGDATLVQYPCSSCHQGVTVTPQREVDAHGNIQPEHPSAVGSVCSTCHVSSAVQELRLNTGETVTLDHAYRLCAQCHFQQAEAWAAGGHGKRLYGWQGRRVVMNCADCHDPHKPGAPQRNPYPGPQLPTP
jgi:hypothetical protein